MAVLHRVSNDKPDRNKGLRLGRARSTYVRRQPESTVLHRVVREHLETFLAEARLRRFLSHALAVVLLLDGSEPPAGAQC